MPGFLPQDLVHDRPRRLTALWADTLNDLTLNRLGRGWYETRTARSLEPPTHVNVRYPH
jgi:hypothetical protein